MARAPPEGRGSGENTWEDDEIDSVNQFALHARVNQPRAAEDPYEITAPFLPETFLDELSLEVLDSTAEGFYGGFDPPLDAPCVEVGRWTVEGSGGEDYDSFGWVGPAAVVRKHEEVVHVLSNEDNGDLVEKLWEAITNKVCGVALAIGGSTHGIGMHRETV